MAGVTLTLKIDDAQILGGLQRMRAVSDDLTPVMTDIGGELEASTVLRFSTNVGPDGVPWAPSKRASETSSPTLVQDGHLRDSIHPVIYSDAVEVGSNLIYAAPHQMGATISAKGEALAFTLWGGAFVTVKSVTLPKRPFLGLSDQDNSRILDIVGEHWAAAAAGGR